jgi:hypothetical protein
MQRDPSTHQQGQAIAEIDPLWNTPIIVATRSRGNWRLIQASAAGVSPPSPSPTAIRAAARLANERARPHRPVARLQTITDPTMTRLGPTRSASQASGNAANR